MESARCTVSLALRAHGGDAAALDELLAELRPLVVQTVPLTVGSGSWAAEDAAQEALLDISRGIGGLRDPAAVRTWALRIATRRALKVARRERLLRARRAAGVEITDGFFNADPTDGSELIASRVAMDGVTSVSFTVSGKPVTVPVKNNVWAYEQPNSHVDGAHCIVAHFADGSTVNAFPTVPCP